MTYAEKGIKGFKVLEPSALIFELINHIEQWLPSFVGSHTFEKIIIKKKNETQHSTAFNVFMMKNQDKFTFMNEVAQLGSYTIDIGVYEKASDDLIFTIEAKVLPTPVGTKSNPRSESEYVCSLPGHRGAGIERFKMGYHGLDNEDLPLPINGMLAYIKEKEYNDWLIAVNNWVKSADWDISEQLQKKYISTTAKFESKHKRKDKTPLLLHHFWVKVDNLNL